MRRADRLGAEHGMTLVELMVAMLILVVGVMATIAVLDRNRALADRSEARATVAFQADKELERIASYPFDRIGHRTLPTGTNVTGTTFRFDQDTTPRSEALVALPTAPAGELGVETWERQWLDGQSRLNGWVRSYITAPDPQTRRVTVVVDVNRPSDLPAVLVSTLVTNPTP